MKYFTPLLNYYLTILSRSYHMGHIMLIVTLGGLHCPQYIPISQKIYSVISAILYGALNTEICVAKYQYVVNLSYFCLYWSVHDMLKNIMITICLFTYIETIDITTLGISNTSERDTVSLILIYLQMTRKSKIIWFPYPTQKSLHANYGIQRIYRSQG